MVLHVVVMVRECGYAVALVVVLVVVGCHFHRIGQVCGAGVVVTGGRRRQ